MDTQEGRFPIVLLFLFDIVISLDNTSAGKSTKEPSSVRIPYSLVPGIDFTSIAYQRVLSTLGKQVIKDKPDNKRNGKSTKASNGLLNSKAHNDTPHEFVTCSGSSNNDDITSMDLGTSSYPFFSFVFLSYLSFLDKTTPTSVSDDDHLTVKQATDVISNDIIIDLVDDCDEADEFLKNALRVQIIQGCQHLRSRLTSVNLLMKKYNAIKPTASFSKD